MGAVVSQLTVREFVQLLGQANDKDYISIPILCEGIHM